MNRGLLLVLLHLAAGHIPTLPVRVSNGLLRGSLALDGSHLRFTGIPYATVSERFQPAQPASNWKGIFEATNELIRCPQKFLMPFVTGVEDCLTLNVYTPTKKRKNKLYPVMVFIHGGGFKQGSGSPLIYGPDYLVKQNVILVTLNYRLNVLGFLCLGIEGAQGNMGLKDQVEALRWVQNNIKSFGGDPDNITIFGESAGSVSVLYHLLSPMSKGLFHKAILESGSAISYWGTQFEPKDIAFKLAEQLGHNTTDEHELLNIFKQTSLNELLSTYVPRKKGDMVQSENIFVPCIEEPLPDTKPFLTESPYEILSNSQFTKVPIMIGFNSAEGYMFVGKENRETKSNFNFVSALPRDLTFETESEMMDTAAKLSKLYTGHENTSDVDVETLVKYEGDAGIRYPVVATTELLLQNSDKPVFSYRFSYGGLLNLVKMLFGFGAYAGASHGDELLYLFKPEGSAPLALFEMTMIDRMTTMWTNFAKYEDPIPVKTKLLPFDWEPTSAAHPKQVIIDKEMKTAPLWSDQALLLWNEIYAKHRRLH